MSDISKITGPTKFTSQLKVSLESAQKTSSMQTEDVRMTEMVQFENEMEQINHAFALVKEIRSSLENALRDLSN